MTDEKPPGAHDQGKSPNEARSSDPPPPLDTEGGALHLLEAAARDAAWLLASEGVLPPCAWFLTQKDLATGEFFPDGEFGLLAAKGLAVRTEGDLDEVVTSFRKIAKEASAIGVVLITHGRALRSESTNEPPSEGRIRAAPEVLYLILEHRALPARRHQIAPVKRYATGADVGPWHELKADDEAKRGYSRAPFPTLLPELN
jgi:hypothetical protein